jgi:hypothetical protein
MNENLKQILMPLSIMGTFGYMLVLFTKALTDYLLKKKMIDKGFVNDETQSIFKSHQPLPDNNKYASLKWGLIVFFAGISLIIMEYLDFDRESPLPYGLFGVSVSLGFLLYFFMVKKDLK